MLPKVDNSHSSSRSLLQGTIPTLETQAYSIITPFCPLMFALPLIFHVACILDTPTECLWKGHTSSGLNGLNVRCVCAKNVKLNSKYNSFRFTTISHLQLSHGKVTQLQCIII